MTKEEFYKVWKNSSREDILNQYYYDYKFERRLANVITKALEYIINETLKFSYYVENEEGQIDLLESKYRIAQLSPTKVKRLLDILKESDSNE